MTGGDASAGGGAAPEDRAALLRYGAGLILAAGLFLAGGTGPMGPVPFGLAVGALALVAAGLARPRFEAALGPGALLLGALALYVPVGRSLVAGDRLADAVAQATTWPQVLVALFAGRLLAVLADRRFGRFWRDPARSGAGLPQLQSLAAGALLGGALAIAFYAVLPRLSVASDAARMLHAALEGDSAIHYAIVLLFFVTLGLLVDAALLHARDRAVLAALRDRLARTTATRPALAAALEALRPVAAHRRSFLAVEAALKGEGTPVALAGFHDAARRFFRALLSFLPLLGFLGTVVGLATAIGALRFDGAAGAPDVGASLAGLALKFETTLLGLVGAIVSAALLAALERREAELDAACLRLVEAMPDAG